MKKLTFAERILAEKTLKIYCYQSWVDWAITMLEQGHEGKSLCTLAGLIPPQFYDFNMVELLDHALFEVGIPEISQSLTLEQYAAEILKAGLSDSQKYLEDAYCLISDLCIANDYARTLYDFYLLYHQSGVFHVGMEHDYYWRGATPENIREIMEKKAQEFIHDNTL